MKKLVLIFVLVFSFAEMNMAVAQGREYIRQKIQEKGECRNVAITKTNGDLMLYGKNGYAERNCPDGLEKALDKLNDEGQYIDDVQLTDGGKWLILYGDNGCKWNEIPSTLEKKLREFNKNKEVITSVTFNDAGQWIVITTEHYCSSEKWIQDWLKEKADKYGELWAACITDDALVAVYEKGYSTYGEVPEELTKALEKTNLDVYRLKIAGSSWFFADKNGSCRYDM